MSQSLIQEIINDLIKIDPEFKNNKSKWEKIIQEIITNKPKTPYTKEFKDTLKAHIIGTINQQKISYNNQKQRNLNSRIHSFKFWMLGFSTITAGYLVFTFFHYIENIQEPTTKITHTKNNLNMQKNDTEINIPAKIVSTPDTTIIINKKNNSLEVQLKPLSEDMGKGASNNEKRLPTIETNTISTNNEQRNFPNENTEYAGYSVAETQQTTDTKLAIAPDMMTKMTTPAPSPTFCETSKVFLEHHNLSPNSQNTSTTFTYDNEIYKATINFTEKNIHITHIGTQDESKIKTELPNLNLFFSENNFNIQSDYLSAISEESTSTIEYYYPKRNQQEGITAYIDKTTKTIYSIKNICIY